MIRAGYITAFLLAISISGHAELGKNSQALENIKTDFEKLYDSESAYIKEMIKLEDLEKKANENNKGIINILKNRSAEKRISQLKGLIDQSSGDLKYYFGEIKTIFSNGMKENPSMINYKSISSYLSSIRDILANPYFSGSDTLYEKYKNYFKNYNSFPKDISKDKELNQKVLDYRRLPLKHLKELRSIVNDIKKNLNILGVNKDNEKELAKNLNMTEDTVKFLKETYININKISDHLLCIYTTCEFGE
jgi:hypothetical protein